MKLKNSTKLIVLISLMSVVLLSIPSISVRGQTTVRTEVFDIVKADFTWDMASYTNFHGPLIDSGSGLKWFRIFIDENDPARNWSKTAADNAWCSGSGIWNDPYVIENLYVNCNGSGGGIYIKSSTVPFIIRDCWIANTGPDEYDCGVVLYWTGNGTVTQNIMTYTRAGVFINLDSSNNTVSENIMLGDHDTPGPSTHGVTINSGICADNTVRRNFMFNLSCGIGLSGVVNNSVIDNFMEDNIYGADFDESPIRIYRSDNSTIKDNIFAGAFAQAVFTVSEDTCEGNIIEGNGATSTLPSDIIGLQIQQATTAQIALQESDYNYIGYNLLYRLGGGIPSYDPFLMMGIIALVSIVSIFAISERKK